MLFFRLRISGNLPNFNFTVSETRLLDILKLLYSIPTPPSTPDTNLLEEPGELIEPSTQSRARMQFIAKATGDDMKDDEEAADDAKAKTKKAKEEQIHLDLTVVLDQVS